MKSAIEVSGAPRPVGAYSQAQKVELPGGGCMVFTAGQVPLDPKSGEMNVGSIAEQTEQVMKNIGAVLAGAGLTFADVVKTTVFLADMNDFTAMNEIYQTFFTEPYPARSTVQAARLPRDARIEIDAIAAYE